MGTRYKQPGEKIVVIASGSDIAADAILVKGDCVVITEVAIPDGESGVAALEGVFLVPKTAGTAWNLGDKLDFDVSAGEFHKGLTTAAGDVAGCAIAHVAAASGDTTGYVKLHNPGTLDPS